MKNFLNKQFVKIIIDFILGIIYRFALNSNSFDFFNGISDYIFIILYFSSFILYDYCLPIDGFYNYFSNNFIDSNSNNMINNIERSKGKLFWIYIENNENKYGFVDRFRRKFYWIFIENRKDHYGKYEYYKPHWNPNVNVYQEFKDRIKIHKETLKWFLNRRNPNK